MPDLRPGQYKRIGRISEKNPERALAVSERMEKRASREERGKKFVKDKPAHEQIKKNFAQGVERQVERQDAASPARREAVKKMTTAEGKDKQGGRDYPLSTTPEPLSSKKAELSKSSLMEYIKSRPRY
jgi:hypothetical protein